MLRLVTKQRLKRRLRTLLQQLIFHGQKQKQLCLFFLGLEEGAEMLYHVHALDFTFPKDWRDQNLFVINFVQSIYILNI